MESEILLNVSSRTILTPKRLNSGGVLKSRVFKEVFKDRLRHLYTDWLIIGEKSYTKGGNMKCADYGEPLI